MGDERTKARSEAIETTVRELSTELIRRGMDPGERITVTVDLTKELFPGRRESRAGVIAAGLSDDDIDRLIKEAQHEVESDLG
jgi:hypothetical protein